VNPPFYGVSRPPAFSTITAETDHGKWRRGLTGRLELSYTTLPGNYVTPGTGELRVMQAEGREVLAQGAARLRGKPVLPGTGIKGAVRTLYEILTGSCGPTTSEGRRGVDCAPNQRCAACRLFGHLGQHRESSNQGRLGFDDATPADAGAVEVTMARVPEGHEPHGEHTPGDLRLYDLAAARTKDPTTKQTVPREPILAREVYTGRFLGSATFWTAMPVELGLLMLALGCSPEEDERFPLRLGGVRFHGQGTVQISVEGLLRATPDLKRQRLDAADARKEAQGWSREARSVLPPANLCALRSVAEILNRRSS
jgi:CRISPR/Cas system CSM-associated protein Csm3 (group 7 of RAMP superfamily)